MSISRISACVITACTVLCLSAVSLGDTVYLTDTNTGGQSWATGDDWSDGQPAQSGNHYVVDQEAHGGQDLRTPTGAGATFPGDSLTIDGITTRFILKMNTGQTLTVDDLRVGGGVVFQGTGAGLHTIAGNMNIFNGDKGGAEFTHGHGTQTRNITVTALTSGAGGITVNFGAGGGGGTLKLTNAANTWSGDLTITTGSIDLDYTRNEPTSVLSADAGGFVLDQGTHVFGLGSTVGATTLSPGTYNAATLNTHGGTTFSGAGSIQIVPEPATLALVAVGLLGLRRRRRR